MRVILSAYKRGEGQWVGQSLCDGIRGFWCSQLASVSSFCTDTTQALWHLALWSCPWSRSSGSFWSTWITNWKVRWFNIRRKHSFTKLMWMWNDTEYFFIMIVYSPVTMVICIYNLCWVECKAISHNNQENLVKLPWNIDMCYSGKYYPSLLLLLVLTVIYFLHQLCPVFTFNNLLRQIFHCVLKLISWCVYSKILITINRAQG